LIPNPIHLDPSKFNIVSTCDTLITSIFGKEINYTNIHQLKKRVILSPTNNNVAQLNELVLQRVISPKHMKFSIDTPSGTTEDHLAIPQEFLHSLTPPGMPPHALTIKVNGIYMLLRNMNVEEGQCNGSRFIVTGVSQHTLHCELIRDDPTLPPSTFILPRITCTPPDKYPFMFTRRQFPIRPAFAMTINKSQGGTFDKVGIELTSPVFTHGQLYVAVSRTSDFSNVTIMTSNNDNTTKNIVFPAIFDKEYIDEQRRILLSRKTGLAPRPSLPVRIETDTDFYTNHQSAMPASILHTSEDPADEHDDWSPLL
jgi:ATP-dependent DNA helicase PIF1